MNQCGRILNITPDLVELLKSGQDIVIVCHFCASKFAGTDVKQFTDCLTDYVN